MSIAVVSSPFRKWKLRISSVGGLLESLAWRREERVSAGKRERALTLAKDWLDSYFAAPQSCANGYLELRDVLPRKLVNGAYSNMVLQVIATFPAGFASSYKETHKLVAERTTSRALAEYKGGPRNVARACAANPFCLVIPCHRVTAQGKLGGYCGGALAEFVSLKGALLREEGVAVGDCGK